MCNTQQIQQQVKDPIQVSMEQQSRVQNDQYVIRRMDETQYNIEAKKISNSRKDNQVRHNVRDAIINNLGRERYAAFDDLKIQKEGKPEEESITLNHAQGSKLVLNGEDVLEFNMAGSSYMLYNLPHKGIMGDDSQYHYKEEKKASWYNKTRVLTWTKLVRTEKEIEEYNASHREQNQKVEKIYGQKIETRLKGKKMNQIRKKESVNALNAKKTRFYMRGPNIMNTGKYKETNLEEYMLELGIRTLQGKLELLSALDKEALAKQKPINIIIQGHSRGAVASGLGAMRLKRWINDNYPSLVDLVKFQLIQYDPVAGAYENYGNNAKIDHAPRDEKDVKKDTRYMSLGEDADTTVVYSLHTQYPGAFTPQYVKNAKRIILTAANHGANIGKVDETQDKASRVTYLAEKNGRVEAFRSTGLSELDEGVYIADDQNNLIRIRNLEEYDALAKTLLSGTITQGSRHDTVRKAVAAWFTRETENQLKEKEAPLNAKKKAAENINPQQEPGQKELTTLATPFQLKKVQEEKDKLDRMPKDTPADIRKFREKKEKYLKAKKSGMIGYVDWLHKQNDDYIDTTKQAYLRDLIKLSYHLEKEKDGYKSKDRQQKIARLTQSVRRFAETENLNSFMPAYLRRELYLGSEEKLREYLGMKAPEAKEEEKKVEEPEPADETEIKEAEKKAEEVKPAEEVEVKAEEKKVEEVKSAEEVEVKAGEKKAEEVKSAEEIEKENKKKASEQFDQNVTGLFSELFIGRGVFAEIMKKLDASFDSEDKEKVSYTRMRAAVERVSKLTARIKNPDNAPTSAELMEAMTALSESANVYYDTHRGHQYTSRGQKRREGCDSIRALASEYYDRLDLKTGGKGYGNATGSIPQANVTSKEIKQSGAKLRELYDKYQNLKDHFAGRERTDMDNIQEKARLFASYERYIEIYKSTHPVKKRSKEMDEIIRTATFYKVQNTVIDRFEATKL